MQGFQNGVCAIVIARCKVTAICGERKWNKIEKKMDKITIVSLVLFY